MNPVENGMKSAAVFFILLALVVAMYVVDRWDRRS